MSSTRGALGYCFVEMTDEATAERCLRKINGKSLPGATPVWGALTIHSMAAVFVVLVMVYDVTCLFHTAHEIQVKPSHLWETGTWVSPTGEAWYHRYQHTSCLCVFDFYNYYSLFLMTVTIAKLLTVKVKNSYCVSCVLAPVRCILCLWEIWPQRWMMGCFMSSSTTATLPVVEEKWCWTAWATPSES